MKNPDELITEIARELKACLESVKVESLNSACEELSVANNIFVAGAGRSALAVRGFAMRLMHLGKKVHMVGDVTTPSISRGDLLVMGSGSGSTGSLQVMAEKAKEIGAKIILITILPDSPIGQLADCVIRIPAPSAKARDASGIVDSIQPMGSLFEQSLFIIGDLLIVMLMQKENMSSDEMFKRHANLE